MKECGKSQYWQIVRGICILAVVMIHCPSGIEYGISDKSLWLILRQIINFPVALFVFMAGYFVNVTKIETDSCSYLLKRGGGDCFFHILHGVFCI